MKRWFLALAVIAIVQSAGAQIVQSSRGREFYCMVMQYMGSDDPADLNHYIRVYVSSDAPAHVRVTVENPSFDTTVTVVPNVASTVSLPFDVEDISTEQATRQAIHIVADTEISAYVIYHKRFSTDSYMALPVSSLGNEYIAVCYQSSNRISQITAPEFGIVGVEDSTDVTITPSSTTLNARPVGVPFTVRLNRGDTYLVTGDRGDGNCDLTGTPINSTKPIAVFSGHERTAVPGDSGQSRDCLVEQIPPNSTLGTSFITVPFVPRVFPLWDYFRVVAPVDSTVVMLDGVQAAVLQAGTFYEFAASQPVRIQTSNPVLVAQYALSASDSNGQYRGSMTLDIPWDPAMMIIPPTQQFLNAYTFVNSQDFAFDESYVNVVIPSGAVASLRLDNQPIPTPFTVIPGTGYSYAQVPTTQASHNITASAAFGIYVYGFGRADSYANTGGAAFRVLNGLLVTTRDVDFGSVGIDTCRDTSIIFRNAGNAPITVWKIWLADSNVGDFSVTTGKPPFTIAPGDSHWVGIKFCPGAIGTRGLATVRFSSDAVERPTITIHGVGTQIGVNADVQVLDYHQVVLQASKDSTFNLVNIGARTANFDSLALTGTNAADFTLVTPRGAITIPPGGSTTVTVRFTPTIEGIETATIHTVGPSGYYASVALLGEGVDARLGGVPDTVDYGNVKVLRFRDSMLTVQSVGKFTASVSGYAITGNDPAQFVLGTAGARVLAPGDTMHVGVRFAPTSGGVKTAALAWKEMSDTSSRPVVYVRGNGAYASVALSPRVIDYGRVKVAKWRDSIVITTNTGVVDADILGYAITGADAPSFVITLQPPAQTLAPGGSQGITVRFAPVDTGFKHAQLVVMNDGTAPDTIADLYGNARPALFVVSTGTDTIRAKVGDTIRVPVRLLDPLDDADITRYRVQLKFDSTMLYPLGIHTDPSWSAATFNPAVRFTPGFTSVDAKSPTVLTGAGVLYSIDMLVLLGDAMETPLVLNDVRYHDSAGDSDVVTTALNHGLFQLVGFCGDSGSLISVGKPLALSSVAPNPLSGNAVVQFTVPALGPVHCALVDMLGREAAVLADGERKPGVYTVLLNAHAVPQGSYTLVMQAGRFHESRRVQIVR